MIIAIVWEEIKMSPPVITIDLPGETQRGKKLRKGDQEGRKGGC